MATIKQLLDRWQNLRVQPLISNAIERTQANFIELQKAQLYAGKTVTGAAIGEKHPYRSHEYAIFKHEMNPAPGIGNPDLFLTGSTYDGLDTEVGDEAITVFSNDEKGPELDAAYPGAIAGLGGIYLEEYQKVLQPAIVKQIKNEL